jgi:hypothetical protein
MFGSRLRRAFARPPFYYSTFPIFICYQKAVSKNHQTSPPIGEALQLFCCTNINVFTWHFLSSGLRLLLSKLQINLLLTSNPSFTLLLRTKYEHYCKMGMCHVHILWSPSLGVICWILFEVPEKGTECCLPCQTHHPPSCSHPSRTTRTLGGEFFLFSLKLLKLPLIIQMIHTVILQSSSILFGLRDKGRGTVKGIGVSVFMRGRLKSKT